MKFRSTILYSLILFSVVPVLLITALCGIVYARQSNEYARGNLEDVARLQAASVSDFFTLRAQNLAVTADTPIIKTLLRHFNEDSDSEGRKRLCDEAATIFRSRAERLSFIERISVADESGMIVCSSEYGAAGKMSAYASDAMEQRFSAEVRIHTSPIALTLPVFDEGTYQGYIEMSIRESYFKYLTDTSALLPIVNFAVLDNNGVIVVPSGQNREHYAPGFKSGKLKPAGDAMGGFTSYMENGIQHVAYLSPISGTDWTMLAEVPSAELAQPVKRLSVSIGLFCGVIILFILFLYVFLTKKLSDPLDMLTESIRQAEVGNYSRKLEYSGRDEFAGIVNAFNHMLAEIGNTTRQIQNANTQLEALAANIPGGVVKCKCDEYLTITYASDGFLQLTGYSEEELRVFFAFRLTDIMQADDAVRVKSDTLAIAESSYTAEYRVIRKGGETVWVLDRTRKTLDENGEPCFYRVLIDITGEKETRMKLSISEERYRIVMEQSDSVIYEWNIRDGTVYYSSNWKRTFDFDPITEGFPGRVLKADFIHPDDKKSFQDMFNAIAGGAPCAASDIRVKNCGEYRWYAFQATTIFDKNGVPSKAVGRLTDINRYRKEAEALELKASKDPLTGLFNKTATRDLVNDFLSSGDSAGEHALLIIDIDNFKAVNDNLGHLFGDAVLSDISAKIRRQLNASDIAGRIGGDEFAVFLKHITSDEELLNKATEMSHVFRKCFTGENKDYRISGSIGAATFPANGRTYEELLKKADAALYSAKFSGKDCVCVYDQHLMPAARPSVPEQDAHEVTTKVSDHSFKENIQDDIFELLYQTKDIRLAINLILELIGNYYDVSRVYIFENTKDNKFCNNTFEWCNTGITSERHRLQNVAFEEIGDYWENFNRDSILYADDVSMLPGPVAELLKSQHIMSILQCAILDDGRFAGYVGFDECSGTRFWTDDEIRVLTFVSRIISIFLLKKQARDEVQRTLDMTQSVMDNMDSFTYVIDKDTYDLLYLNKKVRLIAPAAEIGKKCYSVFWNGRVTPCENCPMSGINETTDTCSMELHNKNFGVWTCATASKMKWENGKQVCLVSCFDITKYKTADDGAAPQGSSDIRE